MTSVLFQRFTSLFTAPSLGLLPHSVLYLCLLCSVIVPIRAELPENFADMPKDVQNLLLEYEFYSEEAVETWGDEFTAASKSGYVKYLNNYNIRVKIDFALGNIQIEGLKQDQHIEQQLKLAIVTTLLTPADPNQVDIYTAKEIGLTGTPFLYKKVIDNEGKFIEFPWRAQRYADYIIEHQLKSRPSQKGQLYWVNVPMVKNHMMIAAQQYSKAIEKASRQYDLLPALISAVIATESSFNPFAVSHAGAYGLMQVMPKTAGADVFSKIKGHNSIPSRSYLFDGNKNIDVGSAYLTILRDQYLRGIKNEESMLYCMIAAYNSGAGHLLQSFARKRSVAIAKINTMTPDQVYQFIRRYHLKKESRKYLTKVNQYMHKFSH